MKRAEVLLLVLAACARIAAPPGGPPDKVAPILIGTVPDSEDEPDLIAYLGRSY